MLSLYVNFDVDLHSKVKEALRIMLFTHIFVVVHSVFRVIALVRANQYHYFESTLHFLLSTCTQECGIMVTLIIKTFYSVHRLQKSNQIQKYKCDLDTVQ